VRPPRLEWAPAPLGHASLDAGQKRAGLRVCRAESKARLVHGPPRSGARQIGKMLCQAFPAAREGTEVLMFGTSVNHGRQYKGQARAPRWERTGGAARAGLFVPAGWDASPDGAHEASRSCELREGSSVEARWLPELRLSCGSTSRPFSEESALS